MRAKMLFLVIPLAILLLPAAANAQQVTTSFAALERVEELEEGDKILVTFDFEGNGAYERIEARLVSLSESAIVIKVENLPQGTTRLPIGRDGNRPTIEIPEGRVSEVRLPKRGMSKVTAGFIGAGAGLVGGIGLLFACYDTCDEGTFAAGFLGMIGGGAALGAILASPKPEEIIYSGSGVAGSRFTWSVAPVLTRRQKGAMFTISW